MTSTRAVIRIARLNALSLATVGLIVAAGSATAAPIISVDVDPGTAGIQSSANVALGSSFDITIEIEDVDAGAPLNGFEFDLIFDPAVITAVTVLAGDFLLEPSFVGQNEVGAGVVELAAISLLPAGAVGAGTLATLHFETNAVGSSFLDLENVILAAPFGVSIPTGSITGGSIIVDPIGSTSPIPEPSALILFAAGLAVVQGNTSAKRRDRHHSKSSSST